MKKMITLFTVGFSLLCFSVQAQSVGVKGGLNIANVPNYGDNNRVSGNVGFYLNSKIDRNWSVQPEVLFSGEGVRYYSTPYGGETTTQLSYIQVPIMFQYALVRHFYLEFGPQIGVLVGAQEKDENDNKYNVSGDYNKLAVSFAAGAGVHVNRQLGFFARVNVGLTDITNGDDHSYYSNVGQLGATLRLQ
jgi:hypothetical protein